MKFRFSATHVRVSPDKKCGTHAYIGLDTNEVTAWSLHPFEHDLSALELWVRGGADSLYVREEDVGSPTFQAVLTLLASEFPDIDDLKFRIVSDQ